MEEQGMRELVYEDLTRLLDKEEIVYSVEEDEIQFIHLDLDKPGMYTCWIYWDEDYGLDFSAIWSMIILDERIQAVSECIKEIDRKLGISFLELRKDRYGKVFFWNPRSDIMFWNMLDDHDLSPELLKTFIEDNIGIMEDLIAIIDVSLRDGTQAPQVVDSSSEKLMHIRDRIDKEFDKELQRLKEYLRRSLDSDYRLRDEIIFGQEIDWEKVGGGIVKFEGLTLEKLEELLECGFAGPNDEHNLAPTTGQFIEFMRRYPQFTAHGFVTSPKREHCLVSIEGIELEGEYPEDVLVDFVKLCGGTDDLVAHKDGLFCCFD